LSGVGVFGENSILLIMRLPFFGSEQQGKPAIWAQLWYCLWKNSQWWCWGDCSSFL